MPGTGIAFAATRLDDEQFAAAAGHERFGMAEQDPPIALPLRPPLDADPVEVPGGTGQRRLAGEDVPDEPAAASSPKCG